MYKVNILSLVVFLITSSYSYSETTYHDDPNNECLKGISFLHEDKNTCAYNVIYQIANTTRKNHVLEIPTNTIIEIFAVIGGPIGKAAKDSYYNEGYRYFLTLKPDGEYEGYLMCAHRWALWSETGTRNWDNRNRITPEKAYYEWELKRKAFGARSWYKADFVWVSYHPSYQPNKAICESIADNVLNGLVKSRPKTPQKKYKDLDLERYDRMPK